MAKRVGIIGAAVTPFKARWAEKTYYDLAQWATREAVKDAQIHINDVEAAFYGIYNDIFERTTIPEHAIHGLCGMQNKFGIRISTGGATGAYTMSAAHAYLAAGRFKTALVLGVEKCTDCFDFSSMTATPEVIKSIGWSADSFFEQAIGWTAADSYAEVVLAYMDRYPNDLKPEITAKISAQLSEHVKTNPFAQRQFDQVTADEVMNSRLVVYPFKELEICVYTEGAAALILAEEETALAISKTPASQWSGLPAWERPMNIPLSARTIKICPALCRTIMRRTELMTWQALRTRPSRSRLSNSMTPLCISSKSPWRSSGWFLWGRLIH